MKNLYPFVTYVLVTTFTPGPNNILAMSHAMRDGLKRTMGFLAGILVGFLVIMLACCFLNVALVSIIPRMKIWLTLLSTVYMAGLAVYVGLSKPYGATSAGQGLNNFRSGIVVQFLNPKVILYGVTVFSAFIVGQYSSEVAAGLFAPLLSLVGFLATLTWVAGGQILGSWFARFGRWPNIAMALLLLYTAYSALMNS